MAEPKRGNIVPEPFVIKRTLAAPADKVWQALTDIKKLKQWLTFFPNFEAKVGFRTGFMLGPDDGHQYPHVVEVLEVVEGQKLKYSWDYGGMSPGSTITFELYSAGDTTKLVLTAEFAMILTDQPDFLKDTSFGWNYTADSLQKFVEA